MPYKGKIEQPDTAFLDEKSNTLGVKSAGSVFFRNYQRTKEDNAEADKNLLKW